MAPFCERPHTADLALCVEAPDLAGLLTEAARGMLSLMDCCAGPDAAPVTREVEVSADDVETLLVDWLSELLYRVDASGECLDRFEVLEAGPRHLRVLARGYARARARRPIKAVTYSGLQITESPDGFGATVTFDV